MTASRLKRALCKGAVCGLEVAPVFKFDKMVHETPIEDKLGLDLGILKCVCHGAIIGFLLQLGAEAGLWKDFASTTEIVDDERRNRVQCEIAITRALSSAKRGQGLFGLKTRPGLFVRNPTEQAEPVVAVISSYLRCI